MGIDNWYDGNTQYVNYHEDNHTIRGRYKTFVAAANDQHPGERIVSVSFARNMFERGIVKRILVENPAATHHIDG